MSVRRARPLRLTSVKLASTRSRWDEVGVRALLEEEPGESVFTLDLEWYLASSAAESSSFFSTGAAPSRETGARGPPSIQPSVPLDDGAEPAEG